MSDAVVVDASEVFAAGRRFAGAEPVVREELLAAGRRSAFVVEASAKGFAPRDEGGLVGSIGPAEVVSVPGGFVAEVAATAEYARYQEEGTGVFGPRRAPIAPRTARVLSWVGRDGVRVFARSVKGTPGTFYMRRALAANRARFADEMAAAAKRVAARLAGGR